MKPKEEILTGITRAGIFQRFCLTEDALRAMEEYAQQFNPSPSSPDIENMIEEAAKEWARNFLIG